MKKKIIVSLYAWCCWPLPSAIATGLPLQRTPFFSPEKGSATYTSGPFGGAVNPVLPDLGLVAENRVRVHVL